MSASAPAREWQSKKAAIALSKGRLAALRRFADETGIAMSKAQALYALVDTLPLAPAAPKGPGPEELARVSAEAAQRCASALERVSLALAPLDALISGAAPERESRPDERPGALRPRLWIDGALARLGAQTQRVEMELSWSSTAVDRGGIDLRFTVSRIELNKQAFYAAGSPLPALAIEGTSHGPLADISPATLTGGARLVCGATRDGWSCELLAAGVPARPALHRFDC